MKKSTLWLGLAACSATFLVGCGGAGAGKAAAPALPEGASVAVLNDARQVARQPAFKQMVASAVKSFDLLPPELAGIKPTLEKQANAIGTDEGLRWSVLSVGEIDKFEFGKPYRAPDVALATAIKKTVFDAFYAEVEKAILAQKDAKDFLEELKKNVAVADFEVAGCKAKKLVFKGDAEKELKENKVSNVSPCMAWLGEDLMLAATSEKGLADQIALYRDGKGASAKSAFAAAPVSLLVPEVGKLVAKFVDDEMLGSVPGGPAFVKGLTNLSFAYGFSADGKNLDYTLSVATADEKTAKEIRDQLTGLLALGKMGLKGDGKEKVSDEQKLALAVLDSIKIGGTNGITISATVPVEELVKQLNDAPKTLGKFL